MGMPPYNVKLIGGSDTRCRQGGTIVPGAPRSGLRANQTMGSSALLAASNVDFAAIAGTPCACTAGACAVYTPAKGLVRGEMPPPGQERRKEGAGETLRLRGGAGDSDDDSDQSQLSVHAGQVLVGGTPLQGVSIKPLVRLERVNLGPSQSAERRERTRERALFEQRSARRAELKTRRGLPTDSEDSDAVIVDRARSLDRGRNKPGRRTGGPSLSEGKEEDEVTVVPAKRGPGRPPTTAEYVGFAAAKEELN